MHEVVTIQRDGCWATYLLCCYLKLVGEYAKLQNSGVALRQRQGRHVCMKTAASAKGAQGENRGLLPLRIAVIAITRANTTCWEKMMILYKSIIYIRIALINGRLL